METSGLGSGDIRRLQKEEAVRDVPGKLGSDAETRGRGLWALLYEVSRISVRIRFSRVGALATTPRKARPDYYGDAARSFPPIVTK